MGLVNVKIQTLDGVSAPIDGVIVRIFDALDVFITEATTLVGEVNIMLNGDVPGVPYNVRLFKAGVSFPPDALFSILVHDPVAPPNDFQYVGYLGMTGVLVSLYALDDAPTPAVIANVRMDVFDVGDTFLAGGQTDVVGLFDLVLPGSVSPGTEYIVRLRKDTVYFAQGATQKIKVIDPLAVGQTNDFDFIGHVATLPETTDPQMCRLSGYFVDASLRPLPNLEIMFLPFETYPNARASGIQYPSFPSVVRDRIIGAEVTVKTDKNGYVEVDLPRKSIFDLSIIGLEIPGLWCLSQLHVPDQAGMSLTNILFPYVTSVTYTPPSAAVAVGDTVYVAVEIAMSNLQEIEANDIWAFLEFKTDDSTIAGMLWNGGTGQLEITGAGVGTTTITVVRKDGTVVPRLPAVPDLIVTPLTVTVS